jgi:hypothetical protein
MIPIDGRDLIAAVIAFVMVSMAYALVVRYAGCHCTVCGVAI